MLVKPFGNKVLVTEAEQENTTESGIVLTGKTGETKAAKVLAVGPGVKEVKVDDVVYLDWGKGSPVKIGNMLAAIISEEHISAVVED
jgi:chaperonin GroES